MKAGTKIRKSDLYFDGLKWVKVYGWMVGQYVAKRTAKRFLRAPDKRNT